MACNIYCDGNIHTHIKWLHLSTVTANACTIHSYSQFFQQLLLWPVLIHCHSQCLQYPLSQYVLAISTIKAMACNIYCDSQWLQYLLSRPVLYMYIQSRTVTAHARYIQSRLPGSTLQYASSWPGTSAINVSSAVTLYSLRCLARPAAEQRSHNDDFRWTS